MGEKNNAGKTKRGWEEDAISVKDLNQINIFGMVKRRGIGPSILDDNLGNRDASR
jgi:hypothetical protein